ncbi:MAG: DUF523 domain-containing protein [Nitrospirae bacterium]|nr:DUF523 domain-containing protein [Nitrospirota bacterium]
MIIVSACLAGFNCRYDGTNSNNDLIAKMVANKKAFPICPEQMGGLSTPRPSAEIKNGDGNDVLNEKGRVITIYGDDITHKIIKGAEEVLKFAKMIGAKEAVLKDKSPSCGVAQIYRNGEIVNGMGVCSAILKREGIEVSQPLVFR